MPPTTPDGVLLVDKPAGMTSHDVVGVARRALGERRIGHAGTLDPFATGLLVVMVGRATRLLPYVSGEPKVYDAVIRLGTETDTDDCTGVPTREAPLPAPEAVRAAVATLTGPIDQVPPAYSAKKVDGVRAYAAARRGAPIDLAPARVHVHDWTVREQQGTDLHVTITCGGGTYIRALARDLGRLAASAAHLASLRRTRSGVFDVADAVPLDVLRTGAVAVRQPLDAVPELPTRRLVDAELARIAHGQPVDAAGLDGRVALTGPDGRLVAIAEADGAVLRPRMVLHAQ